MTHKDNMKKQEDFAAYLNREVLSSCEFERMKKQEDFAAYLNREVLSSCEFERLYDPAYVKEILKAMTEKFREIYGADELSYDMEFVLVPAVIKPQNRNEIYAGIVQLDLTSSGEHYGTDLFTQFGVANWEDDRLLAVHRKILRSITPYDYYPTLPYPGDIHVDWSKCPDDVRDIINYCREQTQDGGMTLK